MKIGQCITLGRLVGSFQLSEWGLETTGGDPVFVEIASL